MSVPELEAPSPGHSTTLTIFFFFFEEMLRIPPTPLPFIFNIHTRKWAGKDEYEFVLSISKK
jgi:hypothetical protein